MARHMQPYNTRKETPAIKCKKILSLSPVSLMKMALSTKLYLLFLLCFNLIEFYWIQFSDNT